MGVERKILSQGNGTDKPKEGDEVTIEYTGSLYDPDKAGNNHRGKQYEYPQRFLLQSAPNYKMRGTDPGTSTTRFDTSKGRGDFKTPIGVGKVIKGMPGRNCALSPKPLADRDKAGMRESLKCPWGKRAS